MQMQKCVIFTFASLLPIFVTGCKSSWIDSLCPKAEIEHQAAGIADAGTTEISVRAWSWPETVAYFQNGAVEHPTVYLEGCFQRHGSMDQQFGTWRPDDAISMVASPAIFVGNIITFPIDAVSRRPWQKNYSRSVFPVEKPTYEMPGSISPNAKENNLSCCSGLL